MVIVDTSVWIDHFYRVDASLVDLLNDNAVLMHPLVIAELACGRIKNRKEVVALLDSLPKVQVVTQEEFLNFIEVRALFGVGAGVVDIHLLASASLAGIPLWTRDKTLLALVEKCGVHPLKIN